jgi:dienelactone hydrolase
MFAAAVLAIACLAGCSDDGGDDAAVTGTSAPATDASTTTAPPSSPIDTVHAVGMTTRTFVDDTRETPRSGSVPSVPTRTLETTIFYPATGDDTSGAAVTDAPPASDDGPYPLVVFSHGLGASPEFYADILTRWASAGFVVAAPAFPLSSSGAPAGPDAGDVQNQPGDVSFVITQVIAASDGDDDVLAGLVDGEHVGVGGHSNGGITTLGVVANSCCRDDRIDAAIVMAGTPSPYGGGSYDFSDTPPLLVVHGTNDALIAYEEGVSVALEAQAPKGMLTIEGGDHGGWVRAQDPSFDVFRRASTDFLSAYLRDDAAARDRLQADTDPPRATMRFALDDTTTLQIPTTAPAATERRASVTPDTGLRNGQTVTVTWSGFTPGKVVNVVQCAGGGDSGSGMCDLTKGKILQPDPTGSGSLQLEIIVGPVGSGACGANEPPCVVVVNDAGLQDPDATIRLPISFAE